MIAAGKKAEKEVGVYKMAINISIFEKADPNELKLLVKGIDETYINTLRRVLGAEVPVLAIEDVEIRGNNSIMYDEILAHRLGLIPFRTDLKSYELFKAGDTLNAKNSLKMTLKGKGPGYLYASSIKTKDPKIVPVYPKIPITKLLEGQDVELEAVAILGKGKVHAKWSPGLFYYHHVTKTSIPKQPDEKSKQEILRLFPKGLFDLKAPKLTIKDENMAMELEDFENVSPFVQIESLPEFILSIESWGQLTPKELIAESVSIMDSLLEEFQEAVATIK